MKRGDIRWYTFAPPDKKRPVLILTRDSVLEYLGEVTVASITSTVRDIPSEIALSRDDGVLDDSRVLANRGPCGTFPQKRRPAAVGVHAPCR